MDWKGRKASVEDDVMFTWNDEEMEGAMETSVISAWQGIRHLD